MTIKELNLTITFIYMSLTYVDNIYIGFTGVRVPLRTDFGLERSLLTVKTSSGNLIRDSLHRMTPEWSRNVDHVSVSRPQSYTPEYL